MIKKIMPFVALIAAGFLLYWVKTHQGKNITNNHITVEPLHDLALNRDTSILVYSKHALCRMDCRHIDKSEVKDILINGKLNSQKMEENEQGVSYPLEGITEDRQHVRIVFAPKGNETVVVTVIDLDKDWPCDCR
ncbi:MAG: DUF4258 domain-containing protein [Chitinophagaceae bacterium]|nr:DUF4258 domain-containing protein [Bacteroidota bacterium]MCC6258574.1 DUF4258 domain-containing protein [Chitinophagaceae bacterium]MCW5917942.1 DUF4258 domain-containing protein [Ferruginibacter sp.]